MTNVEKSSLSDLVDAASTIRSAFAALPTEGNAPIRAAVIEANCKEIGAAGLDADSLIRFGMERTIYAALFLLFVLEGVSSDDNPAPVDTSSIAAWRSLLQLPKIAPLHSLDDDGLIDLSEESQFHLNRVLRPIRKWIHHATLPDLISMRAPSESELERAMSQPGVDEGILHQYVWMAERLTQETLDTWDTPSLHAEYRFVTGSDRVPFGPKIMAARSIPLAEIEKEVARRAVLDAGSESPDDRGHLLTQILNQALIYLQQKRYQEARALFEFYATAYPDDSTAANNAAFCKMPVDPESALHELVRAEKIGFRPIGVNLYNQACCLMRLSQEGVALDRLEYYWQRELEDQPTACSLWRFSGEAWDLYEERDVRIAICRLGGELGRILGLSARDAVWDSRLNSLTPAA